jgi:hypothetical protein
MGARLGHLTAVREKKKGEDHDDDESSAMTGTYTDSMSMTTSLPN